MPVNARRGTKEKGSGQSSSVEEPEALSVRAPDIVKAPYDYAYCVDCQYCRAQTAAVYNIESNVSTFTKGKPVKVRCTHCKTWGVYPPDAFYAVKMWRGH